MKISNPVQKIIFTLVYLVIVTALYFAGANCIFQEFFGIACPGCGMTRAVISVLRLDFAAAFYHHPMVFSLPILYLYFLIDGGLFKNKLLNILLLSLIGAGFIAVWLIKII